MKTIKIKDFVGSNCLPLGVRVLSFKKNNAIVFTNLLKETATYLSKNANIDFVLNILENLPIDIDKNKDVFNMIALLGNMLNKLKISNASANTIQSIFSNFLLYFNEENIKNMAKNRKSKYFQSILYSLYTFSFNYKINHNENNCQLISIYVYNIYENLKYLYLHQI